MLLQTSAIKNLQQVKSWSEQVLGVKIVGLCEENRNLKTHAQTENSVGLYCKKEQGMLKTFPQCNFPLEFHKMFNQNHKYALIDRVSGISKIMHCGILINMHCWQNAITFIFTMLYKLLYYKYYIIILYMILYVLEIRNHLHPVGRNSKVIDETANMLTFELQTTNSMMTALVSGVSHSLVIRSSNVC